MSQVIELVRGFLPLLRPGQIYPADQDLAMELAADLLLYRELFYPKHSSLAHHKESGQSNSEVQVVLHGARRWGLLILEISFIIAVPRSIPIFVTAVRCSKRNGNCRTAHCLSLTERCHIRYSIRHRIRCCIRYLHFIYGMPYRRSKMTYDVVGPKPTTQYTQSYTISYNNLRHRFNLRHRRSTYDVVGKTYDIVGF